jgi:hypothetical protein
MGKQKTCKVCGQLGHNSRRHKKDGTMPEVLPVVVPEVEAPKEEGPVFVPDANAEKIGEIPVAVPVESPKEGNN